MQPRNPWLGSLGRISISAGVSTEDVREQQMPTTVAPEGFQTHQSFVTCATPELARTLEATLILPASRFHCPAALRFTRTLRRRVIHALAMIFKIGHLRFHG